MSAAAAVGVTAVVSVSCTCGLMAMAKDKLLWLFADEYLIEELQDRGVNLSNMDVETRVAKTYEKLEQLGKGASGIVYRVRNRADNTICAMKVMDKSNNSMNDEASLSNEIKCMKRLRHRHVINLTEVIESDTKMFIFMDLALGGGLYDRILALNHFSENNAASIMKQVLKAVHYMHSMGIVHRDLKPENVLMESKDENADVKVADFGLAVDMGWDNYRHNESMKLKDCKEIHGGFCGSPICMAPEVAIKSAKYGPQCDVWSIGCMTYELLSGSPPFMAKNAKLLFKIIRESNGPQFPEETWSQLSGESKEIVFGMLQNDPKVRPSSREALHHHWFEKAKDCHEHLTETFSTIKSRRTRASAESDTDELEDTMKGTYTEGPTPSAKDGTPKTVPLHQDSR